MGDDGGRENDRDENGLAMNCVLPEAEGSWCTFALGMVVGVCRDEYRSLHSTDRRFQITLR